jgi:hypothetical protein
MPSKYVPVSQRTQGAAPTAGTPATKKRGRPAGWRKPKTTAQAEEVLDAGRFIREIANNPQQVGELLSQIRTDIKRSEQMIEWCETQITVAQRLLAFLRAGNEQNQGNLQQGGMALGQRA